MNPGGNYVGARLADATDGKVTVVFTGEVAVRPGERIVVETEEGPEFAEVTTLSPVLAKACSQKKARRFLRLAIAQIFDCALNHAFSPRQRRGIDLKLLLKHVEVYGDMMNPGCGLRQRGDKELQRVCPGGKANAVVCRRSCRNLGRERPYLS